VRTRHRNGGARISTTLWGAVQHGAAATKNVRAALSAGLVTSFVTVLFGAALALAVPAAAADDPSRPDARVTHGPSCRPGGLVVEVVAGTSPYTVKLATTRTPSGEDQATLQPGQTVVLHSADVDYGETIDGRLEFAAQDGSGVTYVDELVEYSFTRPTKADCDAVADPSPTGAGTTPTASGSARAAAGGAPTTATAPTEAPSTGSGTSTQGGIAPAIGGGDAAPQQVTAGHTVTVQAAGFVPGELVTFQLHGSDHVLATATAGPDGRVQTEVRIPGGTDAGAATVHLTGTQSEVVADVALQVAAAERALATPRDPGIVPLVAAAVALVAAAGHLFSVVGRQRGSRPTIRRA
jgi:hypothetical protein